MTGSALIAFDLAATALLEEDLTEGVEQNANEVARGAVAKLRVLFRDELARLEPPPASARMA